MQKLWRETDSISAFFIIPAHILLRTGKDVINDAGIQAIYCLFL